MIKRPTTFIVGAGASNPYGLPLGPELLNRARQLGPAHDLYQLLHAAGHEVEALNSVLGDLRVHPAHSIDAFLATRQSDATTMLIGRAMIAVLMGNAIAGADTVHPPPDLDWLEYVLDRMADGANNIHDYLAGNSEVRFVTFNFDSVIENRLTRDLGFRFRASDAETAVVLHTINVTHVHGRLPAIPAVPIAPDPVQGMSRKWIEWLKQATGTINVVLDAIDDATLATARDAVERGRILCFLGFAYHPDNMARLDIPNAIRGSDKYEVYGSARGLSEGERTRAIVQSGAARMRLGETGEDARMIIRKFPIFLD